MIATCDFPVKYKAITLLRSDSITNDFFYSGHRSKCFLKLVNNKINCHYINKSVSFHRTVQKCQQPEVGCNTYQPTFMSLKSDRLPLNYIFSYIKSKFDIITLQSGILTQFLTPLMLCVFILYISGGTYGLKSTPKDRFFSLLCTFHIFTLHTLKSLQSSMQCVGLLDSKA